MVHVFPVEAGVGTSAGPVSIVDIININLPHLANDEFQAR
jgi:hypothetical protein